MLPEFTLLAVVVAGEEVVHSLFHQGDRHPDRLRAGGGGIHGGPFDRVVVLGIIVVATLVRGEIVRLYNGMVAIGIENCIIA